MRPTPTRWHLGTFLALILAFPIGYALGLLTDPTVEAQSNAKVLTDTVNANADAASIALRAGVTTVTVDITGTFSETLTFNVVGTDADPVACTPTGGGAAVTSATAVGKFVCPVTGWASFNVTGSSYVSGAAVVRLQQAPLP